MIFVQKVAAWLRDHRDRERIRSIARYWHRNGAVSPFSAAVEENYLRLKLEQFRDFASERYLADRNVARDDIKQEWLDLVVKPMAKSPHTREAAKALKAAIQVIGDEMFVGAAKHARSAEIAAAGRR